VVQILLDSRVDPSWYRNDAIRCASEKGRSEVVKVLLADPRVDPSDFNNLAIQRASEHGHADVVLEDFRVDPSANDNIAIRLASEKGHAEVVKILLADSRVNETLGPWRHIIFNE
ncbi:hypothetical protein ROZALSC1DRAFT_26315, partial [Rozella allomycis CSF55]